MDHPKRIVVAALVAPWSVVPLTAIYILANSTWDVSNLVLGLLIGLGGLSFAYLGTVAIGVPAYLLLSKFGYVRAWLLVVVGGLAGHVAALMFDTYQLALLWTLAGASTALIGWAMASTKPKSPTAAEAMSSPGRPPKERIPREI
jgi:hypothetical protein